MTAITKVEAPTYFGVVNAVAMSVFGFLLYYASSSVTTFGLTLVAVVSIITAVVTEASAKGWYKEAITFVSLAFPFVAIGYFATPVVFTPIVKWFSDIFVGFGKYIVSLIRPEVLLFPVVVAVVPLVIEAISVFIRSTYFSIMLSALGYPILAIAVSLPLAISLVAFVSYIYTAFITYVVSVAIVVGMTFFIRLLDTLAFVFGLAVLFGVSYASVRFIPDVSLALASSMVDLAGVEVDFREGVSRFYLLNIFNYLLYAVIGYSYYTGFRDWFSLATSAVALIAVADLSLVVFYMLRQYPTVSPRLVKRVVYLASGVEALAMLSLVLSGVGINIIIIAFKDMFSKLLPLYYQFIYELGKWIFGG